MIDPIVSLEEALVAKLPNNADKIRASIARLDSGMRSFLKSYIEHCGAQGMSADDLAESYVFLVKETMKEQILFKRSGRYRFSKYSEVNANVYDNSEYMRKYMSGLALSTALWENHTSIYYFFKDILASLSSKKTGMKYLEVGAGHGLFAFEAMSTGIFSSCCIVDISMTSIEMCKDMMRRYTGDAKIEFVCSDFLDMDEGAYDFISIGEVLEHVETPDRFLQKAAALLEPGGHIYVSTCLNAPEPDHIYLFERLQDVDDLFAASGLETAKNIICPMQGTTIEKCEKEKLPVNVAYLLRHKR